MFFLNMRGLVLHLYKTIGKVKISYILIFKSVDTEVSRLNDSKHSLILLWSVYQ